MPKLKDLRLQAHLSVSQIARLAEIDRQTYLRAEQGIAVRDVTAYAIVGALATRLNLNLTVAEVTDLKVI